MVIGEHRRMTRECRATQRRATAGVPRSHRWSRCRRDESRPDGMSRSPASLRIFRCCETAGRLIGSWSAISWTDDGVRRTSRVPPAESRRRESPAPFRKSPLTVNSSLRMSGQAGHDFRRTTPESGLHSGSSGEQFTARRSSGPSQKRGATARWMGATAVQIGRPASVAGS